MEQQDSNLKAALAWAVGAQRPAMHAELARLVGHRLYRRGFLREATEIVQQGLAAILPLQGEQYHLKAAGMPCCLDFALFDTLQNSGMMTYRMPARLISYPEILESKRIFVAAVCEYVYSGA